MELARRRWFGVRVTVVLAAAVGLLSVATGVANIASQTPPQLFGFGGFVPEAVEDAAGFTGALTGFLLLISAFAMRRGLRAGWTATVVLLPVTFLQGLVQSSQYSVPLLVGSLAALPVVAVNRDRFARRLSLTATQLGALGAVVGVQVYGTVGTYALREHFDGVAAGAGSRALLDSVYYTVVTASTVGYGDATPTNAQAKLFAMSVVVLGTASFGIAIGALLAPAIEARFATALGRMTRSQLELLEDHVVVLGYGDLTEPILTELAESDATFVVVVPDPDRAEALSDRDVRTLTADPSADETLERVKLGAARAVIAATDDDGADALAVLTAREFNPDARIVAAASDRENVAKLRRAGADTVISPATIGGRLLVQSALGREGMDELAERVYDAAERGG